MKTEYRLARALKDLMAEKKSLETISVTTLTKKCKVNRQTFYYHFHDIFDLLTLVFLQEEIPEMRDVRNHIDLIKKIYNYYEKNSSFIDSVLDSAGKELFLEFIANNCYKAFSKMIINIDVDNEITTSERKTLARYCAAGFSYNITFYLQNTKNKSLDGLLNNFTMLPDDFLKNDMKCIIKKRKPSPAKKKEKSK